MLKPVLGVAALGLAGFLIYKALWVLVLPLVALAAGILITVLKVALIVLLVWVGYKIFKKVMAPARS